MNSSACQCPEGLRDKYRSNYLTLMTELAALTPRRAILAIPPLEAGLPEIKKAGVDLIDNFNAVLPDLAREAGASDVHSFAGNAGASHA